MSESCCATWPIARLFQVARTTLIDHVRQAKPTVERPNDLPAIEPDERAPVDALDACLTRNLAELSPADQDILRACELQNQTVRDFAVSNNLGLAAALFGWGLYETLIPLSEAVVRALPVARDNQLGGALQFFSTTPPRS